nr:T9SS type A sorting domain-containing protein [Bacteroidia bacterium]
CFVKNKATWIGYQVIKTANGIEKYLNYASDTMVFQTQALLNDFWTIFQYPDSSYIRGTVDSVTTLSFMGITDSVKYIRLNRYSKTDTLMNDLMNGVRVIISKNYGWVRTLAWINFPQIMRIHTNGYSIEKYNYTESFWLQGNSLLNKGLVPNFAEFVSDFEVGDEIHAQMKTTPPSSFKEIKTVLSKTQHVDFTVYTNRVMRKYVIWRNQSQSDSFACYIQTDTIHFANGELWPQKVRFSYLPQTKRLLLEGGGNSYVSNNKDSCYSTVSQSSINVHRNYSIQGIGNFYSFSSHTLQSYSYEPVYYKKGAETWGVPLAFDSADFYNPSEFRLISAGNQKATYRQNISEDSLALLLPFMPTKIAEDSIKITYTLPYYPSDNGIGCISLNHSSWLGKKIETQKNGDVIFFNYKNEPIVIKTQAAQKEEWIAYTYLNGDYITAQVDTLITYTHSFPVTNYREYDYKTITFRKFTLDSIEINHTVNVLTLRLSRQNGWTNLTEFNYFPFDGHLSSKAINWSQRAISLLNIHDRISGIGAATILHRRNFDLPSQTTENSLVRTPQTTNMGDTLIKKRIHCKRIDDLSGNKISFTQHERFDTIPVVEYSYLSMQPLQNNSVVKEFCTASFYNYDTLETNNNTVRVRNIRYTPTAPDCWTEVKEDTTTYEYYWPQLGMYQQVIDNNTAKCIKREWPQFGMLPDTDFGKEMFMYCSQLDTFKFTSPLSTTEVKPIHQIVVYPNPASSNEMTILWSANTCCDKAELRITDVYGKSVLLQNININELLNIKLEASGIYILTIQSAGRTIYSGKIIRL